MYLMRVRVDIIIEAIGIQRVSTFVVDGDSREQLVVSYSINNDLLIYNFFSQF